jgi:anti-sigma-K factor RskA
MPAERSIQCDDMQPWLAAYAMGEADDDPAPRAHLAACPRCQGDLAEYRLVAEVLPYSATDAVPVPELRDRVVAAVARQAGEDVPTPASASGTSERAPARAAPRQRFSFSSWAALVFAGLAVALLAWNLSLRAEINDQSEEITYHRQSWQTVIALLNDSSVRWYALAGGQSSAHAWATPQGQDVCFVAQALPEIGENQVLQVWVVAGGRQTSIGTFEQRNSNAWVLFKTNQPLASYDEIFVTVEPNGGSEQPSGPHVLSGSLVTAAAPSLTDREDLLRLVAQRG